MKSPLQLMLVLHNNFILPDTVTPYKYSNVDEFTFNLVALTYFKASNNFMEAAWNVRKQKGSESTAHVNRMICIYASKSL